MRFFLLYGFAVTAFWGVEPSSSEQLSLSRADATWELIRADLEATPVTSSRRLEVKGTVSFRLASESATELNLFSGGAELIFARGPTGSRTLSDSISRGVDIELEHTYRRGDSVSIAFRSVVAPRSPTTLFSAGIYILPSKAAWYPAPAGSAGIAAGTVRLRLPEGWASFSGGRTVEHTREGDLIAHTWTATLPTPMSFVFGKFAVDSTAGRFRALLDGAGATTAASVTAGAERVVSALEKCFGRFPFESYAIVEVPDSLVSWYGASYEGFLAVTASGIEPPFNVPLFAHELGHAWWGVAVRSAPPAPTMVSEALAQFGALLAIEALEGPDSARKFRDFSRPRYNSRQSASGYFGIIAEGKDAILSEGDGDAAHLLSNAKGHWVYHMLRNRMGKQAFCSVLAGSVAGFKDAPMSLDSLRSRFFAATPSDKGLAPFLEQWLDRPGAPRVTLTWEGIEKDGHWSVKVSAVQAGPVLYALELPVGLSWDGGERTDTIAIVGVEATASFRIPSKPTAVTLDPQHDLLLWRQEYDRR